MSQKNAEIPDRDVVLPIRERNDKLLAQLRNERESFVPQWRDLADYIVPQRGRFFTGDRNKGDRRNLKIIDSTATFSARTLSAGMMAGSSSPARRWFELTTFDPDLADYDPVKRWLHDATTRVWGVLGRSNFYDKQALVYGDLGTFGTAAMAIMEDDADIMRCFDFPLGSFMLGTDARGQVTVFAREFEMTVRQMVEKFVAQPNGNADWSRVSVKVRDQWNRGNTETWIPVAHLIQPNVEYDAARIMSQYKAFRSCYYEVGSNDGRMLEDRGFDEFPIIAPRWDATSEDVYGSTCPGMIAIGDVKALQIGEKRAAQAIEKMVSPPLVGLMALLTRTVSQLPGNVTYEDVNRPGTGLRPIHEVNPRILELESSQEGRRYRIKKAYYEDLFLMLSELDRREITATEIAERKEEKLLALGPVQGRLNRDGYDPTIDRVFAIMLRRGMIPRPPRELEGANLKIEYTSVMAQAQKLIGLGGLDRFSVSMKALAEVDPTIVDIVDTQELAETYAEMTSVPPKILRTPEQVAEIRQERARQQQAAQAAATLKDASAAAKNLGSVDTSKQSALTDLMAGAGAGAQ